MKLLQKSHERCPKCGRLLAKKNGEFPPHRVPAAPPPPGVRGVVPYTRLTGQDDPWCKDRA